MKPPRSTGVRLIVGCRLDLQCGTSLLVYPTDRAAYGRLCRLLTRRQDARGQGPVPSRLAGCRGMERRTARRSCCRTMSTARSAERTCDDCARIFGDRAYCALTRRFLPDEAARLRTIANAAAQARVPTVVTNDVLYHCPIAPHVAGCRDLHPAAHHDRQRGVSERAACRPLPENARRDAAALSQIRSRPCGAHGRLPSAAGSRSIS